MYLCNLDVLKNTIDFETKGAIVINTFNHSLYSKKLGLREIKWLALAHVISSGTKMRTVVLHVMSDDISVTNYAPSRSDFDAMTTAS